MAKELGRVIADVLQAHAGNVYLPEAAPACRAAMQQLFELLHKPPLVEPQALVRVIEYQTQQLEQLKARMDQLLALTDLAPLCAEGLGWRAQCEQKGQSRGSTQE